MHTIKNTSARRSLVATVMAGSLLTAVLAAAATVGSAPKLTITTKMNTCRVEVDWTYSQPSDWYSCSIDYRWTDENGAWSDWAPLKSVKPDGASYVQCAASDKSGLMAKRDQKLQIRATGYQSGTNQWKASPDSNEVTATPMAINCSY